MKIILITLISLLSNSILAQEQENFETVENVQMPDEMQIMDTKNINNLRTIIHKKLINYYKKIYKYYPEHLHTVNRHVDDVLRRYYTEVIHQNIKTFSESDINALVERCQVMPTTHKRLPDRVGNLVKTSPCGCLSCGCR